MRHVFIINPAAGKTDSSPRLTKQIHTLFEARDEEYYIAVTQYPGHACEIAQHYAADGLETTLYACGGDGTLGEVAQALPGNPQLVLAPVPIGTGNDFVRTLLKDGGDRDNFSPERLLQGQAVPFDLMLAGGRVSLNIASVGLDAVIAQNVVRFKRLPLVSGPMAYKLSLVYCFFAANRFRCRFEIDGEALPTGDFIFAIAANGRYYGSGFRAAPLADMQDGLIDFIRIPALSRLKILPMISHYKRGEHLERYPFIQLIRCRQVRIVSDEPVVFNCDGEVAMAVNPVIEILPSAARLLLPPDCVARYTSIQEGADTACAAV